MFAAALSHRLERHGLHYAWVMVALTFFVALTTAGVMGLAGAFLTPFTREFGWDTAQISSALALRLIFFGVMAPFAAASIERYGLKRIILSALGFLVVGLVAALFMSRLWHLVVAWGIFVGVGTGLTAMVMSAIVATRWFAARRGLVLGLLTASTATGQLIFLPFATTIEEHFGWRWATAPSIIALGLVTLAVLFLLVERPADIGLSAYGETKVSTASAPPQTAAPPLGRAIGVLGELSGSSDFWILFGTFVICGLSTNGLIQTHFIAFCGDNGMAATAAASTLAMMGIFDLAGTIGSGWLSDRYDNRMLLSWYYGLRGLSLLYLPSSNFTVVGLSAFAMFYGLDWIATVPPTVKLSAQCFGKERAAIAFGWIFCAHQLGAAIAAFAGGVSRTQFLTYLPAFYGAGIVCLIAAAAIWGVRRTPSATVAPKPALSRA